MNEVYMFLIVFSGVFTGIILGNLFQAYLSAKRVKKHLAEMERYSKDMQKARTMDIEKLDRVINKKRGRKKKTEQTDIKVGRATRQKKA